MSRRPWAGLGVSLALHAGVLALALVVVSREDALPALIVDLREGFVPAAATIRSLVRDVLPGRGARSGRADSPRSRPAPTREAAAPESSPPAPPSTSAVVPAGLPSPALVAAPASEPPASAVAGGGPVSASPAGGGPARGGSEPGTAGRADAAAPSPAAAPGNGGGVGAEYGPYLRALRQRIQQSVHYPASARRRGVSGTVSVEIVVLANGAIGDVTLLGSSGHATLDEAALETLRALPRTPLPPELPARPLRVRIPVVFEMRAP